LRSIATLVFALCFSVVLAQEAPPPVRITSTTSLLEIGYYIVRYQIAGESPC
jgi:hypothetical protein